MVCRDCGYVMAPFETACPRCTRLKALKKTRRLPDLRSMATQRLVQLEQCRECNFMLFPGDTQCSACGAPTHNGKAETRGPAAKDQGPVGTRRHKAQSPVVLGIVVSAVTVAIVLFLYRTIVGR